MTGKKWLKMWKKNQKEQCAKAKERRSLRDAGVRKIHEDHNDIWTWKLIGLLVRNSSITGLAGKQIGCKKNQSSDCQNF